MTIRFTERGETKRFRGEDAGGVPEDGDELEEEEGRGRRRKHGDCGLSMDVAWDVMGGWLDRGKVRKGRTEEVGYMKRKMFWDEVSRSEASGHRMVSVERVDTHKGTEENPEIRSRLVARDFRGAGQG